MSKKEGLKIGFQDDSATVADISESSTVAIVDVGQRQLKKIEAPNEGRLTLHIAMIAFLNSPKVKRQKKTSRYNTTIWIQQFFSFLKTFNIDEDVPNDCLNSYVQYQRSQKKTDKTIYSAFHCIKKGLRWCFGRSSSLNEDIKYLCRLYHIHAPSIRKPVETPTPPLSRLFAQCPYNDTQLLDSLKKLCIWIINYEAYLRNEALQIDGIRQLIDGIRLRKIDESPISIGSFSYSNTSKFEASILYGTIVAHVRDSNNLVLKERLVTDIRHPIEKQTLSKDQLNWVLDRSLKKVKEGEPPKCIRSYTINQGNKKKDYAVGAFRCLSIRNLLVPSDIECFAMQCLLACEKMNSSSIEKLSLDDVVKVPQGIQFQFQKPRRPTPKQANISTLHTLGSTIGKTYLVFIEAMKSGQDHFSTSDQVKLLNYLIYGTKEGHLGVKRFGQASNRYFELLLTNKSHLRNQLLQDFKESSIELEPVFWLLGKVFEQNKKNATQHAKYDRVYKQNKSQKRSELVTESAIGLTIEVIRQSAIISEDAKLLNSPHFFNDLKVTAQLTNHSSSVHNTVYIDRSTAKEKIESDRLFVSRIGALMEQDANLMGNLLEETSVLDYNQALEALGLPRVDEGAHERISKKIDELGIDTDLMDSFQVNGKKIFLGNKVTIALIIKYLEHIRANFDDVVSNDSLQLTKTTLAARDYFYFSAILQRFPDEIRKKGEKYASSLSFSYAKLSDLVGISKNG